MADAPEENESDDAGEAEAPKGRFAGKKKLIVIAGAAMLLLGGGGAVFMMMGGEETPPAAAAVEGAGQGQAGSDAPAAAQDAVFYDLPSLLVNLATDGSRTTYLRVAATLELVSSNDVADVRKQGQAITDGFQAFLREMRPSDLSGSGGLMRLKETLRIQRGQKHFSL